MIIFYVGCSTILGSPISRLASGKKRHSENGVPSWEPAPILPAPARRFASLMPLNKKNGGNGPKSSHNKSKRLKLKPEPPKHEEVAERHGDPGDKNNQERTVHRNRQIA
jgi:hypothetical protein